MRPVLIVLILLLPLLAGCLTQAGPSVPEPIPAAVPHEGDKGLYTLLKAPLSEGARQQGFSEDRRLNISFEFEGASAYYDRDGMAHTAWDFRVRVANEETMVPWRSPDDDRFHIDPGTFQVLGTTSIIENNETRETHFATVPINEGSESNYARSSIGYQGDLPCGLLESWLGGYFPLPGQAVPATVDCSWRKSRWNQEAHEVIARVQAEGEPPLVVVEHHITYVNESLNTPAPEWRAWYVEGNPYPVRMQDLVGGNFGAPGDELLLVDFERGTGPLPIISPEVLRDVPPLVEAPVTPWTVPDLGIEHPWPLHEAFNYARADPDKSGFRDFMEKHPDAYLAYARHVASDVDDAHSEQWSFAVVDQNKHYYVSIIRDQRLAIAGLEEGPMLYRYKEYGTVDWLMGDVFPSKERLPRQLPTPESILAQWAVVMSDGAHPATSPSYSISIHCGNDCETFTIDLGAGATYYHREGREGYPAIRVYRDTWESSELTVRQGKLSTAVVTKRTLDYAVDDPFNETPFDFGA